MFLYGGAAAIPARRVLGAIRNRGFEELCVLVGRDRAFAPDFGPDRMHPSAGAVGVGARPVLIAYNINLATGDVGVAVAIPTKQASPYTKDER